LKEKHKGIAAMIGACFIWGLSPIFYKQLVHIPPQEILAHRALWSLVFFAVVLVFQGRLGEIRKALAMPRRAGLIALASFLISINWFLFIFAIQIGRTTETSLGYYIYPLIAVLIGRFWFGESLGRAQWLAVGLAILAVSVLTVGLGVTPWISLVLASTFSLYGVIKKELPLGPVVSVTCEILMFMPVALVLLVAAHAGGQGAFGKAVWDSGLLIASGPVTALPLILFSFAARRVAMSTVGLLQYLNPTLQFFSAVLIFGEPFTLWHGMAFVLIWVALAVFSIAAMRQDRAVRSAVRASFGVSAQVTKSASEGSANP
jgi:chloramphenicol-sensitive protein RarD